MYQSILCAPRTSQIQERSLPEVGPADVLVEVKACGVCASELHGWQGDNNPYPRELGHEVAGLVVATGPAVTAIRPGMRVTGLIHRGFAEYACADQAAVTRIPDNLPYQHALGEPLGCVLSGARRTRVEPGDTVAIVGLGFMGLLMLQALRLRGPARLIAIDPRADARRMACVLGAHEALAPEEVPDRLKLTEWAQLGQGHGVDVAVEASGTQAGLTLAGQLVREHGFLSIVGYHQGGPRTVELQLWNWKALDVLNAHERRSAYLMDCIRRGLDLAATGSLTLEGLVTHRFPLSAVDSAFQVLQEKPPGFTKAVIALD